MLRNPAEYIEVKLRVPKDLRLRLEAEATLRQSSLNGETLRRIESSFDDTPRATLATAAEDYGTAARDLRQVADRIENEWNRLGATQTFLLLTDLLTTKILDHNVRDASGAEISTHAWTEFFRNLEWLAKELRGIRASVDHQRRDEWSSGTQS